MVAKEKQVENFTIVPRNEVYRFTPTLRNPDVARRREVSKHPTTAILRVDYPSQSRLRGQTNRVG